jgi:alkylation response protein AidB-like acyl-CoA dehydrogenase
VHENARTAAVAQRLAEELLFPAAREIDASEVVPQRFLDALADAGLYGLVGPQWAGGLDADAPTAASVVEALGGSSLTAAFVWIQHHSPVRAMAAAPWPLRDAWLTDLCSGRVRAGIAYAALRRPGPPAAEARPAPGDDGWILDGFAPWVTGWGLIDVVLVGARAGADVVWLLIDAADSPTCSASLVDLAALAASSTVTLRWTDHYVPASRVVGVEPYLDWVRRDSAGRQLNGYLSIGVAARCCSLLGPTALHQRVTAGRAALDSASSATVADARARASVLAVRAAAALVASGGGRSIEADQDAARLMREATFLLVFAQTSDIRAAQLEALGADGGRGGRGGAEG